MTSNLDTERKQLLEIFPNEIWEKVLDQVHNYTDYHKISSSSPYFHYLLLPKSGEILFPELISILLQRQRAYMKLALPLRQVCHTWKDIVDKFLVQQNLNYFSQFPGDLDLEVENKFVLSVESFEDEEDFTRFERHFDATHLPNEVNPFLYRGISINITVDEDDEDFEYFLSAMDQFLGKYGKHLWFFQLYPDDHITVDPVEMCHKLQHCLEQMPNLRAIIFLPGDWEEEYQMNWLDYNHVFPETPQLQFAKLDRMPTLVLEGFFQANPQVKVVDAKMEPTPDSIKFYLEEVPNLSGFAVNLGGSKINFAAFKNARVTCPLTKLFLNCACLTGISWEKIFRALKMNFGDSLEQLSLSLPQKMGEVSGLELGKVKSLNLQLVKAVPLDFLLSLEPTLEKLTLTVIQHESPKDFNHSLVKVYEFWNQTVKSNLWTFLPNLKLLRTSKGYRVGVPTWHTSTKSQWKVSQ